VQQHYEPNYTFRDDDPLPVSLGKCVDCGYTFEPSTGIVVDTGNPAQIKEVLPIIEPSED
jgi:hypothetical protein